MILSADFDERTWFSWDSTRNDECIRGEIDLQDLEILYRNTISSHTTSHAHTRDNAPTSATATSNRTGRALFIFLAVASWATAKAMALYDALKAFALRHSRDADHVARSENRDVNRVPALHLAFNGKLSEMPKHRKVFQVAFLRGVGIFLFARSKSDLSSIVPFLLLAFYLCHRERAGGEYRRSADDTLLIEDLRHATFGAEHIFHNEKSRNGKTLARNTIGRPRADVAWRAVYSRAYLLQGDNKRQTGVLEITRAFVDGVSFLQKSRLAPLKTRLT